MEISVKAFFAFLIVGLLFLLAILFGAQNEQLVTVSYFVAEGEYRLPVVLAIVFLSGFVLSWLFASFYLFKMKMSLIKAQKSLVKLNAKLNQDQQSHTGVTP